MKRIYHYITVVCVALFFAACEVIPEGDRLEEVIVEDSRRVVLLEEFTGVRCTNCPKAAEIAHDLIAAYPDNIVVIGLHGENTGTYGLPFSGEQDFRVPEVKEYFDAVGGSITQGYPCGMVNRAVTSSAILDGGILMNYDVWSTEVVKALMQQPLVDIYIEPVDDENLADSVVKVNVTVETLQDVDFPVSLIVQLTEDNIVGSQVDGGSVDNQYVHNHVLRTVVNGTWGESISLPAVGAKSEPKEFTITIRKAWVKENCSVIAYLYNADTKGDVLQASILSLGENANH